MRPETLEALIRTSNAFAVRSELQDDYEKAFLKALETTKKPLP